MAGKLIISTADKMLGIGNSYNIFINNEKVASLKRAESIEFNIETDSEFYARVGKNAPSEIVTIKSTGTTKILCDRTSATFQCLIYVDDSNEPTEKPKYDVKGARGRYLKVYEDKCIIGTKAGVGSFITGNGSDGEKTIYYNDVLGVQYKRPGMQLGYLQLETASGTMNNKKSDFFNENSFTFDNKLATQMEEIARFVKKKVDEVKSAKNAPSSTTVVQQTSAADELKKFKELLDMGVITQEEFDAKKKQILGL